MMFRTTTHIALAGVLGVAIGCGNETTPSGPVSYANQEFGVTLQGFEGFKDGLVYNAEGDVTVKTSGFVTIEGQGTHEIGIEETVQSVMEGARVDLTVSDRDLGRSKRFDYLPSETAIVLSGDDNDVAIVKEPDGSYVVAPARVTSSGIEFEYIATAKDGCEAYELLNRHKAYATSPHIMMTAFGLAQTSAPASRGSSAGFLLTAEQDGGPAVGGAVCETFQQLCDCVARELTGRGTDCNICGS